MSEHTERRQYSRADLAELKGLDGAGVYAVLGAFDERGLADDRFWVLFDRVVGQGTHRIESRFQFAPGPLRLDGGRVRTAHDYANLLLWPISAFPYSDIRIEEGEEDPRSGWYSPRYGLLEPAPCPSLEVEQLLPFSAVTLLYPYRGAKLPDVTLSLEDTSATVQIGAANAVHVDSCLP